MMLPDSTYIGLAVSPKDSQKRPSLFWMLGGVVWQSVTFVSEYHTDSIVKGAVEENWTDKLSRNVGN